LAQARLVAACLGKTMSSPLLEVIELSKSYGATAALQGVSFEVARGEMFGLLGPNGAGKTTLLSIVSGLLPASSGSVRIHGQHALPMGPAMKKQIGSVPQELALYDELTARENLLFFGQLYGMATHLLAKRVNDVLAAVGLADKADSRVETFSGGMKRRLNLGAAIVHAPVLLFLDEPTTGVDPQSRNHIFEEIRRVNREGTTVVYTSHYMEEVQALCPRVGILDHGRLIACDTVESLLREMDGWIRLKVPHADGVLRERLLQMKGLRLTDDTDGTLEVECRDVKGTLLKIVGLLNELQLELTSLETQEPNLERVFLHLTGRALRD
jgi:ABC-2 type transport system ATP-binding protein